MRCLLYSLVCVWLIGCASDYRYFNRIPVDSACVSRIVPRAVRTSWYHVSIDVVGNHVSGLLLIKNLPDSSRRIVFTSEAGLTFFDFGFSKEGEFKVYTIIKRLNRQSVIKTLRKDFELILGFPFRNGSLRSWTLGEDVYFGSIQKKETAYFITTKDCASLRRLEWGTGRRRKVSVQITGSGYPLPERLEITHHTFAMKIILTRFEKE